MCTEEQSDPSEEHTSQPPADLYAIIAFREDVDLKTAAKKRRLFNTYDPEYEKLVEKPVHYSLLGIARSRGEISEILIQYDEFRLDMSKRYYLFTTSPVLIAAEQLDKGYNRTEATKKRWFVMYPDGSVVEVTSEV